MPNELNLKAIREKAASGFCFCPEYERTLQEAVRLLKEAKYCLETTPWEGVKEEIRAFLKTVEGDE